MLLSNLSYIVFQDLKERTVYWFLFPILGLLLATLFYVKAQPAVFYTYVLSNILIVTFILLVLFLYTRIVRGKKFLNHSFGMGDVLFFYAFALGFPIVTFIILLAFSILFSLLCFYMFKNKMKYDTVPLAGLQSGFLILVFLYSFCVASPSLYIL